MKVLTLWWTTCASLPPIETNLFHLSVFKMFIKSGFLLSLYIISDFLTFRIKVTAKSTVGLKGCIVLHPAHRSETLKDVETPSPLVHSGGVCLPSKFAILWLCHACCVTQPSLKRSVLSPCRSNKQAAPASHNHVSCVKLVPNEASAICLPVSRFPFGRLTHAYRWSDR